MVRRKYRCDACGFEFTVTCDKRDPDPDCPECKQVADRDVAGEAADDRARMDAMLASGKAPAVLTHKSKAMNYVEKMAMDDYGLTDMRDNTRPGESHYKPDSEPTNAQVMEQTREVMQAVQQSASAPLAPDSPVAQFWGPQQPSAADGFWAAGTTVASPLVNADMAKGGADASRAMGRDPVSLIHEAGKAGALQPKYDVVAKAKMEAPA